MQLFGRNDTEVLAQVTNVLTAVGVSVSSANINTGGGEGPVRDVFRVTDEHGNKVGPRPCWQELTGQGGGAGGKGASACPPSCTALTWQLETSLGSRCHVAIALYQHDRAVSTFLPAAAA